MKILIYFISFFVINLVFGIISPTFQYMGDIYRVTGCIFTEILGLVIGKALYALYKNRCALREKQRITKKAHDAGKTAFEYIQKDVPPMLMKRLTENRGQIEYIKKDVKGYVKRKELSDGQGSILIEEFSKQR